MIAATVSARSSNSVALSVRFKAVPSEHERLTLCRAISDAARGGPDTRAATVADTRQNMVRRRSRFILVPLPVLVTSPKKTGRDP